ncbi:MAG: response regulator [bacterium]|nr:response regulator [bacterium]
MSEKADRTILIVDDEESISLLYSAELEDRGYVVRTQNTGREVPEDVARWKPDLIVLDIKMPDISGLELLQVIKESHPQVLVVMNSAYSTFQTEPSVQKADGYVVKSSDLTELMETIERLLFPKTG